MSRTTWMKVGTKQLNLRGGGGKVEYLFGAALAIIIIGSLALSIYSFFGGGKKTTATKPHYQCQKCGYEFEVDYKNLPPMDVMTPLGPEGLPQPEGLDCPKCGEKKSCLPMIKCPNCGKYYVPESVKDPRNIEARNICPHCQTDQLEWYREHRKKRN